MKKLIALVLSVIMCISFAAVGVAADNGTATLYETYGDSMLFGRDAPITLAGTAKPGAAIAFEVINAANEIVVSAQGVAASDGTFAVSSENGIAGGYDKFTVKAYADGTLFDTLENVVFGVLWIASGQSNMQLSLGTSKTGIEMMKNSVTGSAGTRFLDVAAIPKYNGSEKEFPFQPQLNIPEATWKTGNSDTIYNISAVAFFYAQELEKELNMPVGMLCISLGGSSIYSWLSREAIENDPEVLQDLKSMGRYIAAKDWKDDEISAVSDITANYNKKVEALQFFNSDGMIWYQGESDISAPYGYYSRAFDLMQRSYSEVLGFDDSLMPIVYTDLADYHYNDKNLILVPKMNMQFSEMQTSEPDTRAVTTIYDVPLDFYPETHVIHPICKKPVGEKMAHAALGLVYDKNNTFTAPMLKSSRVDGKYIYMTFSNVGDGLVVKNIHGANAACPLYGFSICGADEIYLPAQAQIVSTDTVKVWNDKINNPSAAAYAYSEVNEYCNLFSTEDRELIFGASPVTTSLSDSAHYWQEKDWASCDFATGWNCNGNDHSGYYDAWENNSDSVKLSFNNSDLFKGMSALQIDFEDYCSIGPVMFCIDGAFDHDAYEEEEQNYSDYSEISFKVKNTGESDISFDGARFYTTPFSWFTPAISGTTSLSSVIPADGEWHTVSLNLNRLYLYGSRTAFVSSNDALTEVCNIKFTFSGEGQLLVDDFEFTADADSPQYILENIRPLGVLSSFVLFIKNVFPYLFENLAML